MFKHLKSINLQDFHLNSTQLNARKERNKLPGNNKFPFEDKQTSTHLTWRLEFLLVLRNSTCFQLKNEQFFPFYVSRQKTYLKTVNENCK